MKLFVVKSATAELSNFDVFADVFETFDAALERAKQQAKHHRRDFVILSVEPVGRAYHSAEV